MVYQPDEEWGGHEYPGLASDQILGGFRMASTSGNFSSELGIGGSAITPGMGTWGGEGPKGKRRDEEEAGATNSRPNQTPIDSYAHLDPGAAAAGKG